MATLIKSGRVDFFKYESEEATGGWRLPYEDPNYFRLDSDFLGDFQGQKPNFGFNGLGEFVFYRTYSRVKPDGTKESFLDTITRVVEGCYEIQRQYCRKMHIPWTRVKAQLSAQEMFERIWQFKFLPPGRGLWMMGTEFMWSRGGASLCNCAFVSTKDIASDFSEPFCFQMDMSMIGVGVGFDVVGAGQVRLTCPADIELVYQIADSREGWVDALRYMLDSYSKHADRGRVVYDYSEIRQAGSSINGFGGTASGPGILHELLEEVREHLNNVLKRQDPVITSVDIVDIHTYIGKCVVAGNVRRTSLLSLGHAHDADYCNAKNCHASLSDAESKIFDAVVGKFLVDGNAHITLQNFSDALRVVGTNIDIAKFATAIDTWNALQNHRWASNNSVLAEVGDNYDALASRTAVNGEPGYFWLDNVQNYGRMIDGRQEGIDGKALGTNPCFAGSARLLTENGYVRLDDLWLSSGMQEYTGLGKNPLTTYGTQRIVNRNGLVNATQVYHTGTAELYRVTFSDNSWIDATAAHEFIIMEKSRVKRKIRYREKRKRLNQLVVGDLIPLNNTMYFGTFHDPAYAELAGWCIGDGSLSPQQAGHTRAKCSCYDEDIKDALPRLSSLMRETYHRHTLSSNQQPAYAGWRREQDSFNHNEEHIGSCVLGRLLKDDGVVSGSKHHVPNSIWNGTKSTIAAFIRGLASADGYVHIANNGTIGVRISQSNHQLLLDCRLLLSHFDIHGSVHLRREAGQQPMNDGKGGVKLYNKKPSWELIISGRKQSAKFLDDIGFIQERKMAPAREWLRDHGGSNNSNTGRYVKVKSIECVGSDDTFCLTEPEINQVVVEGYQVGQCSEQSLEPYELCTLVETFPVHHENAADFHRTLKFAYLYAKTVTLLPTHNHKTNAVMLRNRRIGLSQSGIVQAFKKFGRRVVLEDFCDVGYKVVDHWDTIYSNWLCCRTSIKKTSIKPSGSVSLVSGVTPGIHYTVAPSRHYWRRVRVSATSKLIGCLLDAGYKVEPSITDPDRTAVVVFGISDPDVETVNEVSMWEQVKNSADYQAYWSDNQVSCTIQFRSDESNQIADVLEAFETELKSISFLPLSNHGYAQPPYEAATEEEVNAYNANLKPLDFTGYINEDAIGEKFCDGEACQVSN